MTGAAFSYHRAVAPMMWVLVGLGTTELLVVHVMLSFWYPRAAMLLSALSLVTIGWLVWAVGVMRRRPVVIGDGRLLMRVGAIKRADIPLDRIAGAGGVSDRAALRRQRTLNLALVAFPNVLVELTQPLPGRRGTMAVAHRLDDPAAFLAALESAIGSRDNMPLWSRVAGERRH